MPDDERLTGCADGGDEPGASRAAAQSPAGADRGAPVPPGVAVEGPERLRAAGRPRPAAVPAAGQLVRRVVRRGRRQRQHGGLRRRAAGCRDHPRRRRRTPAAAACRPADLRPVPAAVSAAAAPSTTLAAARCRTVRTQRSLLTTSSAGACAR